MAMRQIATLQLKGPILLDFYLLRRLTSLNYERMHGWRIQLILMG
jgi:hypothetical protein